MDIQEHSHRRKNILTGEWVLVSPHRAKRPWQGKVEKTVGDDRPTYDPSCYLCPGNTRASGDKNPQYEDTFVFTNDFAALANHDGNDILDDDDLLVAEPEKGLCRVICFSPDHSLTLPRMSVEGIEKVIRLWQNEYRTLGALDYVNYVQIFENKGEIMGCSNPHPHGQIWATSHVPNEPLKEQQRQAAYFEKRGQTLLSAYLAKELASGDRILLENDHFVALVPFWATWPYETMIISRTAHQHINQFDDQTVSAYADILKRLTTKYDNLFEVSFPYSAGIHQAPTDGEDHPEWHFHMHFYPPLLRSATVKKFMVGFEMLGYPQRDITAEMAAQKLRDLPEQHYLEV
ncbi:MAG: UDP-glucose--hexose-1-phosphate uridylyltransferase [Bacteroidota bacterium]